MALQSAVCPQCGQIDAVRKVSSIVSEGTTQIQQTGIAPGLMGTDFYLVGLRGSSVTNLAQRLAPEVRSPGGISIRVFLATTAMVVGSTMACGLSMFSKTQEFALFACGNWVVGSMATAVLIALLSLIGIARVGRKQAEYERMMERARRRWGQLYYCARDDIAFNPDDGTLVLLPSMSSYLYR